MHFLSRVCSALTENNVRYALVGGYAVALHGAVRGTVDVDVALAWSLKSLQGAERALTGIGLVSRLPVTADDIFKFRDEYIENRNLIGWNFYNPDNLAEQADIVINYDLKGRKRVAFDTAAGKVQVLSLRDLIAMKKASGRQQDLEDARALEQLQ